MNREKHKTILVDKDNF